MKKILLINKEQFGYHIDLYKMYDYLSKNSASPEFICWDEKFPKMEDKYGKVRYIKPKTNIFQKNIDFIINSIKLILKNQYEFVFVKHFIGCSFLLPFIPMNKIMMDIRASSDKKNIFFRWIENGFIKFESLLFKKVSIISDSLRKQFKIDEKKSYILPLGADIIDDGDKQFDKFNLIYVGTFYQRKIEDTLTGFISFYENYKDKIQMSYTIVGDGEEINMLKKIVKETSMENNIFFKGYIPNTQLKSIFKVSNIGVSYIPITTYFNYQPPTKTFEYLLSGMPVIATRTHENCIIVNDTNGVLIDDNSESFSKGLEKLYHSRHRFKSKQSRASVISSTWDKILSQFMNDWLL